MKSYEKDEKEGNILKKNTNHKNDTQQNCMRIASEWYNRVHELLEKLPLHIKKDINFTIYSISPKRPWQNWGDQYFIEKGKYCKCYYGDRGEKSADEGTFDIEEAVYWVLYDITQQVKVLRHLYINHKIRYIDFRRQWFKSWQEIFDIFGQPYSSMLEKHISTILKRFPFDDTNTCKLDLFEDYEKIAISLKDTIYYKESDWCKKVVDRMLTSYRNESGGIANFDHSFKKIKKQKDEIASFLKRQNDKTEIKNILHVIKNTEYIENQYL